MLYRNKKTGVIVDIQSEAGGVWEPVVQQAPAPAEEAEAEKKTPARKRSRKSKE